MKFSIIKFPSFPSGYNFQFLFLPSCCTLWAGTDVSEEHTGSIFRVTWLHAGRRNFYFTYVVQKTLQEKTLPLLSRHYYITPGFMHMGCVTPLSHFSLSGQHGSLGPFHSPPPRYSEHIKETVICSFRCTISWWTAWIAVRYFTFKQV
jgi:hypothetical protein